MNKGTKRLLSGLALTAGALGAVGAILMRNNHRSRRARRQEKSQANVWARPGMKVVFRAELMPGRDASERTFQVMNLLPSGRVMLEGVAGEHAQREFEPLR
jgi:hypothetical protein